MILLSACLAGISCKYNGEDNRNPDAVALVHSGRAIPVCPERLGGFPTPRPAAEIRGGDGNDVLDGTARVVRRNGDDVSAGFIRGAEKCLTLVQDLHIKTAIMKNRSPSCGVSSIYNGDFSGTAISGSGVCSALLMRHGIQVCSEEDDLSSILEL